MLDLVNGGILIAVTTCHSRTASLATLELSIESNNIILDDDFLYGMQTMVDRDL